jgi:S-adenosylmethionine synthetase
MHGTGTVAEGAIEAALSDQAKIGFSLTPKGIRNRLGLNKPIYQRSAAYGHFGRQPDADGGFSWEKTDLVEKLRAAVA